MIPATKAEAREIGLSLYATGKACCRGHVTNRYTSSGRCAECVREENARPERLAARAAYVKSAKGAIATKRALKKFRASERGKQTIKQYRDAHRPEANSRTVAWQKRNPDRVAANRHAWRAANADRYKATYRAWVEANRDVMRAHHQKRSRAQKLSRKAPAHELPFIQFMYEMGNDLGLHVDHVIPLRGKNVSGLHVLLNLRLLAPTLNLQKNNKFGAVT